FYDKVRLHDPSCGIFREGAMQEAVRMQLQHWNLIGAGDFSLPYLSSVARFCEFNQRAGVAPQWYIGCRLMFVAGQLIAAVETVPRFEERAQAAQDRKAAMVKAIATANMLDTEHVMAFCFGANSRQGFEGGQARASACRPLNVSRLGSFTPAR
ncbi:MAG: protoglobin domain-containing protein, partial [Bradyrhizobium sp.]